MGCKESINNNSKIHICSICKTYIINLYKKDLHCQTFLYEYCINVTKKVLHYIRTIHIITLFNIKNVDTTGMFYQLLLNSLYDSLLRIKYQI